MARDADQIRAPIEIDSQRVALVECPADFRQSRLLRDYVVRYEIARLRHDAFVEAREIRSRGETSIRSP